MSRTITIHSDGTGRGTVVLNEDGTELRGVTHVEVSIPANGVAESTIEVIYSSLNITAELVTVNYSCPSCGNLMEHTCDPTIGSFPNKQENQCGLAHLFDDGKLAQCIRGSGHPDSHFDGKRVWE